MQSYEDNIIVVIGPDYRNTMPLFGKSQKSPAELVRSLKDAVTALERGDKKAEKAQEDVSKNLVRDRSNFNLYLWTFSLSKVDIVF